MSVIVYRDKLPISEITYKIIDKKTGLCRIPYITAQVLRNHNQIQANYDWLNLHKGNALIGIFTGNIFIPYYAEDQNKNLFENLI
jgi:hypothetical protein